jgi:hypothetical protein
LAQAIEHLEHTMDADVPGHELLWALEANDALTELDTVLRRHAVLAEVPDGLFSEVDQTRPTLNRRVGKLRREHRDFLVQVQNLQTEVQQAAYAVHSPHRQASAPAFSPESAATGSETEIGTIHQHLTRFLNALREHQDCENSLVIESVTTDLGAGD